MRPANICKKEKAAGASLLRDASAACVFSARTGLDEYGRRGRNCSLLCRADGCRLFPGDNMIRKAIRRMSRMCGEAWYIFMGTLKLGCAMLLCAFMLLISPDCGYEKTMLAAALAETPQGLLLVAFIASALLEERHG